MRSTVLTSFAIALSVAAMPLTAGAAEISGVSKISSVMVFPSGAEVSRSFTVDLPEGPHEVVISDLPADLDGRSLRIEGEGPVGLEIGSIDHKVMTVPLSDLRDPAVEEALKQRLQEVNDERTLLEAAVSAVELQTKLLNEMAMLPSRQMGRGEEGSAVDLTERYTSLYNMMGEKYVAAQANALRARAKIRELDKELRNLHDRLGELPTGQKQLSRLTVHVVAGEAGTASFTVRYQVNGAGWRPSYEARLDTGDESGKAGLSLVRRAVIFQRSAEDWEDVALSLSTTNPRGRTSAPKLTPWLVEFEPEEEQDQVSDRYSDSLSQRAEIERPRSESRGRLLKGMIAAAPAPAKHVSARVNYGQFQMSFKVADRTSVKRNGEEKKVLLDRLAVDPKVTLYSVPKKDRRAYLLASFDNGTENALIPGALSLFRDGVYVGSSRLDLVEPGQKAEIGFGVDPKVNVQWVRLNRVKGETGLITSSNSDVHRYKITIANGHKKAMDFTVLDQMPFTEMEDLKITLLKTSPRPSREDVNDLKGVMAWDFELDAGGEKDIEFGYQLIWPSDKKVTLR